MKKYIHLNEAKIKYKYVAYREVINYKYKSIKPYREYLILTSTSETKNDGSMIFYKNVLKYTKEKYSGGKISNKMLLIPVLNMCIDIKRDGWEFKGGEISI